MTDQDPNRPGGGLGPPPSRKKTRRRRFAKWGLIALLLLLVTGELVARYAIGLGDPPLMQADLKIEYLFKPDQDCRRFHNHIKYNHWSMRSDDFPQHKNDPGELRVLVIGDSVVNGGVLTDQDKLATSILQRELAKDLRRPVVVGNISAGSWGPPNEAAYLKRYGLFDADVLVIVVSSHDYVDVPTFEPVVGVDPGAPDHKPWSALWEGIERYLLARYRHGSNEGYVAPTGPPKQSDIDACNGAMREMIQMARANRAKVIVALHLDRDEAQTGVIKEGHDILRREAKNDGAMPVELGPPFALALRGGGKLPYRDGIHPNENGQRMIATTLLPVIEAQLGGPSTQPATGPAAREQSEQIRVVCRRMGLAIRIACRNG